MEEKEYAPALPKNSINTPIEHTKEGLVKELHDLRKENARLRQNNEYYKLEYIEIKKKLFKVQELINK
jgi:hypothetical protein|tara:strand:+ start:242 stop:445 length:204 start_codon:yes stop_codon:yes gene_type:complete